MPKLYCEKFFFRPFFWANLSTKTSKSSDLATSYPKEIIPSAESLSFDMVERRTFFIIFKLLKLLSAFSKLSTKLWGRFTFRFRIIDRI